MKCQQRRTDTTYGNSIIARRELTHQQQCHRQRLSEIKSTLDTRPPAPQPHLTLYGRDYVSKKRATTEAAFSDLKMIQAIARTMTRKESRSTERKGPISLNAESRKQEIYNIMHANHKLLENIERVTPELRTKDLIQNHKDKMRYVINASHTMRLSGEYDVEIEKIRREDRERFEAVQRSTRVRMDASQRLKGSSGGSVSLPSLTGVDRSPPGTRHWASASSQTPSESRADDLTAVAARPTVHFSPASGGSGRGTKERPRRTSTPHPSKIPAESPIASAEAPELVIEKNEGRLQTEQQPAGPCGTSTSSTSAPLMQPAEQPEKEKESSPCSGTGACPADSTVGENSLWQQVKEGAEAVISEAVAPDEKEPAQQQQQQQNTADTADSSPVLCGEEVMPQTPREEREQASVNLVGLVPSTPVGQDGHLSDGGDKYDEDQGRSRGPSRSSSKSRSRSVSRSRDTVRSRSRNTRSSRSRSPSSRSQTPDRSREEQSRDDEFEKSREDGPQLRPISEQAQSHPVDQQSQEEEYEDDCEEEDYEDDFADERAASLNASCSVKAQGEGDAAPAEESATFEESNG